MPLTASNQLDREHSQPTGNSNVARRILAGIEALILGFVLYIAAGVQEQKLAMAKMQATAEANSANLAVIPALTIRVVEVEKDVAENRTRIKEVQDELKDMRTRKRLE
jgi:hypothetical protein